MSATTNTSRAKRWIFTLFDPAETFGQDLEQYAADYDVEYFVFQYEIAPTTQRLHAQGFIIFTKLKTFATVKRIFTEAHWEVARGNQTQCRAYCTKEATRAPGTEPYEYGVLDMGNQGQRTDLMAVKTMIDQGASELAIAEEHFATWARGYRAFREYKRMKINPRSWKTEVWLIVGPTGTGKTLFASTLGPPEDVYFKQNSDWWDGYDGQPIVVLDDFYGWIRFDEMLRLMDRYPLIVQTKGGQTQFLAKTLLITSNTLPKDWYSKIYSRSQTSLSPFYRRLDKMRYLGNNLSIASKSYLEFQERLECMSYVLE